MLPGDRNVSVRALARVGQRAVGRVHVLGRVAGRQRQNARVVLDIAQLRHVDRTRRSGEQQAEQCRHKQTPHGGGPASKNFISELDGDSTIVGLP